MLASLAEDYEGRVIFLDVQLDGDGDLSLAADLRVRSHPHFVIVDPHSGDLERLSGRQSKETLADILDAALAGT